MISKCGIYTSKGKRVLLATRAVVNGRKAVAYVKNGQLQAGRFFSLQLVQYADGSGCRHTYFWCAGKSEG